MKYLAKQDSLFGEGVLNVPHNVDVITRCRLVDNVEPVRAQLQDSVNLMHEAPLVWSGIRVWEQSSEVSRWLECILRHIERIDVYLMVNIYRCAMTAVAEPRPTAAEASGETAAIDELTAMLWDAESVADRVLSDAVDEQFLVSLGGGLLTFLTSHQQRLAGQDAVARAKDVVDCTMTNSKTRTSMCTLFKAMTSLCSAYSPSTPQECIDDLLANTRRGQAGASFIARVAGLTQIVQDPRHLPPTHPVEPQTLFAPVLILSAGACRPRALAPMLLQAQT